MAEQMVAQQPRSLAAPSTAQRWAKTESDDLPSPNAALESLSQALNTSAPVVAQRAIQAKLNNRSATPPIQRQEQPVNNTGLPDTLKAGAEALSGLSLDHVRVHRNSPKPAQLQAHAYAQGGDIHLGPGQEQHLPHETWHVVQQAQGRVAPTLQLRDAVMVNTDVGLEREADRMGALAVNGPSIGHAPPTLSSAPGNSASPAVVQGDIGFEFQMLKSDAGMTAATENPDYQSDSDDWDVVLDGKNIEIQTNTPLSTEEKVGDIVGEMADFGDAVKPGKTIRFKKDFYKITTGDDSGQPQINFDMPVDNISEDLPEIIGAHKASPLFQAEAFHWKKEETQRQIKAITLIEKAYPKIGKEFEKQVGFAFKKAKIGDPDEFDLNEIKNLLFIFASQVVQTPSPHYYSKDVPVLIKSNIISIINEKTSKILDRKIEEQFGSFQIGQEDSFSKSIISAIYDNVTKLAFIAFSGTGKPEGDEAETWQKHIETGADLIAGTGGLRSGDIQPSKSDDLLGLLIELRRVGEVPVANWVEFAKGAFGIFGELFSLPEKEVGDKKKPEEEDDDGIFFGD